METLNIKEACELLKISETDLGDLARLGVIPGTKIGQRWVFIKEDLLNWLREKIRVDQEQRQAIAAGEMEPEEFRPAVDKRNVREPRVKQISRKRHAGRKAVPDLADLDQAQA